MDETVLREKLGELLSETQRVPGAVETSVSGLGYIGHHPSGVRREMAVLEDSLNHLRLAIKYLVFDLEATKRENRLLRELLG